MSCIIHCPYIQPRVVLWVETGISNSSATRIAVFPQLTASSHDPKKAHNELKYIIYQATADYVETLCSIYEKDNEHIDKNLRELLIDRAYIDTDVQKTKFSPLVEVFMRPSLSIPKTARHSAKVTQIFWEKAVLLIDRAYIDTDVQKTKFSPLVEAIPYWTDKKALFELLIERGVVARSSQKLSGGITGIHRHVSLWVSIWRRGVPRVWHGYSCDHHYPYPISLEKAWKNSVPRSSMVSMHFRKNIILWTPYNVRSPAHTG